MVNSELTLANVVDVIKTKTDNEAYRNLVFETKVTETDNSFIFEDYNVKCVPVELAQKISKVLKESKQVKTYTSVR